jgi:phage shock protein E
MKLLFAFLLVTMLSAVTAFGGDARNITVEDAAKMLKADTNIVVLDVRTPAEFKEGHIKGATNINFQDKEFAKKVAALDKSKTYIIHCQAGGRSGRACEQIKTLDFKNMHHMNQGFGAWSKAGQPVEK